MTAPKRAKRTGTADSIPELTVGDRIFDSLLGETDLIINAAWLYYHESLTQAEVAQRLGVSRPSATNLLPRAREKGVVRISVRPDYLSTLTLAREVRKTFGLQDALIAPSQAERDALYRSLGRAGALYLEHILLSGEVLATAWGATILEVARSLSGKTVENLTIAQSLGGLSEVDPKKRQFP